MVLLSVTNVEIVPGSRLPRQMISAYSIPALLAFFAKLVILHVSRKAMIQDQRARLFRVAVVLSLGLNVAEFILLQKLSYQVNFVCVATYYALSSLMMAALVHLAISISIDTWRQSRLISVYVLLYGTGVIIAALFAFGTFLMMTGIEDLRGYTVTTVRGPLYIVYEIYIVVSFVSMIVLPAYGLRKDRDKNRRDQCKLWIAATAPIALLVLTVLLLLQLDFRWFNVTVTSPLLFALMLATIGYVVQKRPIIELDFYIPGSKGRKHKISFYQRLSALKHSAPRASSLSELVEEIASVLGCPVALVSSIGVKQASKAASPLLSTLPLGDLSLVEQITMVNEPNVPSSLRRTMAEASAVAIVPFFPETRSLSFWLICGDGFDRRVHSALDFKRLKLLLDNLSGCLLERAILETGTGLLDAKNAANGRGTRSLEHRLGELEVGFIRSALVAARGNKAEAARLLGIRPNTLHYKLRRYGIE